MCEQEQLASDLDRALSLSQLNSLAASRKLASGTKLDKSKGKGAESRIKEHGIHSSAKGGKQKLVAKALALETTQKVKGQKKTALFSPVRSELSSCSNSEYQAMGNQTVLLYVTVIVHVMVPDTELQVEVTNLALLRYYPSVTANKFHIKTNRKLILQTSTVLPKCDTFFLENFGIVVGSPTFLHCWPI